MYFVSLKVFQIGWNQFDSQQHKTMLGKVLFKIYYFYYYYYFSFNGLLSLFNIILHISAEVFMWLFFKSNLLQFLGIWLSNINSYN